jgi:hypothetical protein
MDVEQIARVCHEANRAYCLTLGDRSQLSWDEAPEWQKESARQGVKFRIENPEAPASAQHDAWRAAKEADGWTVGPVKDPEKKQHPCMVDFYSLPSEQQTKDHLFAAIVDAFPR